MPDPSDLVSFAELAEAPLEVFRAQLQVKLSRLGLPCDRPSVTTFCATMASLIMDPQGVTLHSHPGTRELCSGDDLGGPGQGPLRRRAAGA